MKSCEFDYDTDEPLILKAARYKLQSQIMEAMATLTIYFEQPAGIGEHSDILLEVMKYIDILDGADSKLSTLDKYFGKAGEFKQLIT